jgi:hypothetical protein
MSGNRTCPVTPRLGNWFDGWLGLGELGVAFDEFFGATAGEGYSEFAVVFVAFDADDGADSIFGMADFLAEHGVGAGGFFAEG